MTRIAPSILASVLLSATAARGDVLPKDCKFDTDLIFMAASLKAQTPAESQESLTAGAVEFFGNLLAPHQPQPFSAAEKARMGELIGYALSKMPGDPTAIAMDYYKQCSAKAK
mgnify:FL=1